MATLVLNKLGFYEKFVKLAINL